MERWQSVKCHVKGQSISIDLLFAMMMFLLLFNAALSIWGNNALFLQRQTTLNQLQSETMQVADLLVRHSGNPENWEEISLSEVDEIGLARTDRILDDAKVARLVELADEVGDAEYDTVKIKMLAGRDFYFKLTNAAETVTFAETALHTDTDNFWAVKMKRIVVYGGEIANAELTLYMPK